MTEAKFQNPCLIIGKAIKIKTDGTVEGIVSKRIKGYYRVSNLLSSMFGLFEELVKGCKDNVKGLCVGAPLVSFEGKVLFEAGHFEFRLGEMVWGWFLIEDEMAHGEVRIGELVFAEETKHWKIYEERLNDLARKYKLFARCDELRVKRVGDELYFLDGWGRVALKVWDGGYKLTYKSLGWELEDAGEVLDWLKDRVIARLESGKWVKVSADRIIGEDFWINAKGEKDVVFLISFGGLEIERKYGVNIKIDQGAEIRIDGAKCDRLDAELWEYLKWLVF